MGQHDLHRARELKKDEFYTQLSDIENELKHYRELFRGKTVLCNCDDPRVSNFFHYFSYNFEQLGLKKLITTCYKNQERDLFSQHDSERAIWLEYTGDHNGNRVPDPEEIGINYLQGDGDFRSAECIELLKQADIVVTNPPFSLFREYLSQLVQYNKQFIIIGNTNALKYKECFQLFMEDKIRTGYTNFNTGMFFVVPDTAEKYHHEEGGKKVARVSTSCWYTNMPVDRHKQDLIMYKAYNEAEYPKFDNYDAINVNTYTDIPVDYYGIMGVPITFLDKYNPAQFENIGCSDRGGDNRPAINAIRLTSKPEDSPKIGGKKLYTRVFIRRRHRPIPYATDDETPLPMAAEE